MRVVVTITALLLSACTTEITGAELGEELFDSKELSPSSLNDFACSTCHDTDPDVEVFSLSPGYGLYGVANRPSYWGGDRLTLRDAVDACLVFFMRADPIDPETTEAHALYEYLQSISPSGAPRGALSFTVVENIVDVPRGDPERGRVAYDRACARCHGDAFTAAGGILHEEVNLPAVTATYPEDFPGVDPSLVVIEKIRHGRFFDISGNMALFSTEALSDADVGAILAYLEL